MTATMHFLPWMRRGLAQSLSTPAAADGTPATAIAEFEASVMIGTTEAKRRVRLRGPGSVVGIAPDQIVRRFPPAGAPDFEVGAFPAVELLSPELPWMFTPAGPSEGEDSRLIPWFVLVVVEDRAGVTLAPRAGAPLEVLTVDDATRELPDLREAWAWAHVQATIALDAGVAAAFEATPEAFVARLLCPRRLVAGTRYIACLVPSFEAGRLAGLGQVVPDTVTTQLAWEPASAERELPVYSAWRFATSAQPADFEVLVKRLVPRVLNGVGAHALDIGEPGSKRLPTAPGTVVTMRGALVAPGLASDEWPAAHREPFQRGLRGLLTDSLVAPASDPEPYDARRDDPVVAPPVYGALSAKIDHVPRADGSPRWLAEANLDPTHRAAAGLGAEVIRENQEQLVAEIWDQVGAIRDVNRRLARARLALEVGTRIQKRFERLDDGTLLQLSKSVHARLKRPGMSTTLAARLEDSALPAGLVSGAFRRGTRATTVSRAVARSGGDPALSARLTRAFVANPETMLTYAQFTVPYRTVFDDGSASVDTTTRFSASKLRVVDMGSIVGLGTGGATSVSIAPRMVTARGGLAVEGRAAMGPSGLLPPEVLVAPVPVATDAAPAGEIELRDAAALVRDMLDPRAVLRVRMRALVTAPAEAWTSDVPGAMRATPQLGQPAYELLARLDPELLCPGVSQLAADTVGIAHVNAAFVEAFLLGANHELARELIWREVPVDPRDTWMRTFWDATGEGAPDIKPVARWHATPLGTHRPERAIDPDRVLVLVIKSELLRRYPTTLVYAVRAAWDNGLRVEGTEIAHPIFVGALGADTMFLGFDLGVDDPQGDAVGSTDPEGPAGWFFVFEEPATEPWFGLDSGDAAESGRSPALWRDVSWFHAAGDGEAPYVPLAGLAGTTRAYDEIGENTWPETWARDAAAMARITLQRPVRMVVHGDQMLPGGTT